MLMRSEQGDGIDAAIAAAAQALTSGEPSAALRGGVRDRIGRRRTAWWFVPAAAVAAAVLAAIILGRATPPAPGAPVNQPTPAAPALVSVPAPQPQRRPVDEAVAVVPPMRRLAAPFEPVVEELEPLIPPIAIPPLETTQIVVDVSSGVMPIEIEPLRIEPLQGE
jgi:hypothetical protein